MPFGTESPPLNPVFGSLPHCLDLIGAPPKGSFPFFFSEGPLRLLFLTSILAPRYSPLFGAIFFFFRTLSFRPKSAYRALSPADPSWLSCDDPLTQLYFKYLWFFFLSSPFSVFLPASSFLTEMFGSAIATFTGRTHKLTAEIYPRSLFCTPSSQMPFWDSPYRFSDSLVPDVDAISFPPPLTEVVLPGGCCYPHFGVEI